MANKMKYGILTFHNIPNFGALLQAYSLCQSIRSFGYECEIIDYSCDNIIKREREFRPLNNKIKSLLFRSLIWPKTRQKIKYCDQYMKMQGVVGEKKYTKTTIKEANNYYDGFITGSDMVWNLKITNRDYSYFMDFTDEAKKRFSYGSSIGEIWDEDEKRNVKGLLERYDCISVREEDTCDMISRELGIDCRVVADPTMLLTAQQWIRLSPIPNKKEFVLVYFPQRNILSAARRYAKQRGKKVLVMNWDIPIKWESNIAPNSPTEWIGYFCSADAVFTNSYHGLLFALYFHKPVWTDNYGNRQKSLLQSLGLNQCFLKNDPNFEAVIDYESCDKIMNNMREESLEYIKNALEKK
jgi:hypothetical protein